MTGSCHGKFGVIHCDCMGTPRRNACIAERYLHDRATWIADLPSDAERSARLATMALLSKQVATEVRRRAHQIITERNAPRSLFQEAA